MPHGMLLLIGCDGSQYLDIWSILHLSRPINGGFFYRMPEDDHLVVQEYTSARQLSPAKEVITLGYVAHLHLYYLYLQL